MFLEMYLKIIVTIIVDSETSKRLAKQAFCSGYQPGVKKTRFSETPFNLNALAHAYSLPGDTPLESKA